MLELVICNGSGQILKRFELSRLADVGDAVLVGRAEECDIRLRHPAVSRRHLVIERKGVGEWRVRDLGSRGGVVVDGERVPEIVVRPELELAVGPAVLRFAHQESRIAAELERDLADEIRGEPAPPVGGE